MRKRERKSEKVGTRDEATKGNPCLSRVHGAETSCNHHIIQLLKNVKENLIQAVKSYKATHAPPLNNRTGPTTAGTPPRP